MPLFNYRDEGIRKRFLLEKRDFFRPHPGSIFDRVERPIDISMQADGDTYTYKSSEYAIYYTL